MALMKPPENLSPEETLDEAAVVALEEDGDVQLENIEYSGVVGYINSAYQRSKDARLTDEERWLESYRNYRGLYGPDVQFTDTEKSKAFVKITKTKVLAAYSQIIDVLFAGSKFPIGIEARKFPNNVAGEVSYDPQALTTEKVKEKTGMDYEVPRTIKRPQIAKDLGVYKDRVGPIQDELELGPGINPGSITFEPAKKAAQTLEKKMHDQLEESAASKHLRSMSFEMALFGTGIIKGPFAFDKEYPRWNSEGEYDPLFETIPKIEYVSIWDFYPDPDARNMDETEFTLQRHRLNRLKCASSRTVRTFATRVSRWLLILARLITASIGKIRSRTHRINQTLIVTRFLSTGVL